MFVLTLFAGRLVQLQGLESTTYQNLAKRLQLTTIALHAMRGSITGADGQVLAMTVETFTIVADPKLMSPAQRVSVAARLAGQLHTTQAAIEGMLAHPSSPEYQVLARGVPAQAGDQIVAENLPEITAEPGYTRVYPDGDATADVVGFTNSDGSGVAGLEQQYNKLLSGRDGSEQVQEGSNGVPIPLAGEKDTPPVNGASIRLTIIPALQYQAEQECRARVVQTHAHSCTVVIIQPKTGHVLAMAQWPTYSQSHPAGTSDHAVSDVFEPGSTAKIITAAAAFEHGGQTPMTPYNIPYQIDEGGQLIHDAEWSPGERYTIAGVIANSSNVGMAQVATHISAALQYQYLRAFGLGQPTGIGLPGESAGILHTLPQYWESLKYTLAYGQGVSVTALQMAEVYATLANDGVHVDPTLVAGVTDAAGHFTPNPVGAARRVIKASTARELIKILQQVPAVDKAANQPWGVFPGYAIAMKTGTSSESGTNCPHTLCDYGASLIGMGPGDNPQVVVAVNVQDPSKAHNDYFGDVVAGPVFAHVMQDALQDLSIPPDGARVPKVRLNAP